MPQREFHVTAPMNPAPRWPDGYIAVLREAGAQEKAIPYCIGWVKQFFAANPGRQRRDAGRTEIEAFLKQLTRRAGVGNWQIQQARDALELYYERFRGIPLAPRPDILGPQNTPPPSASEGSQPAPSRDSILQSSKMFREYARPEASVNVVSDPGTLLSTTVQALLGHSQVETTMIYTHVLNKGPMGVVSPVDTL